MTTIPNRPAIDVRPRRRWASRFAAPEPWASPAISVIWLVVLCDALWDPDIISTNGGTA
jgi:hypothetical protein